MDITGINPPIVEVSRRVEHDPTTGDRVIVTYEGTEQEIKAAYIGISDALRKTIDDSSAPVWRLIVESPDISGGEGDSGSPAQWGYELIVNSIGRSLYEHPRSQALPQVELRRVKECVATGKLPNELPKEILIDGAMAPNPLHATDFATADGKELHRLMLSERNSYADANYAFRIIQVISPKALAIAAANTGKIYSTNQVIAETGAPTEYAAAIQVVAANYHVGVPSGDRLGWLKQPIGFSRWAGEKLAVVGEYWLESWSTYMYSAL